MKNDPIEVINGIVIACFVGTWIILGVVGLFLFYLGKDVAFKRRWFPRFIILVGVLFVMFSTTIWCLNARSLAGLSIVFLTVPMTFLISYLNIKFTRFCGQCGATLYNQNWFVPMRFCPKCGAGLDAKPEHPASLLE